MIPFETTAEQKIILYEIATHMRQESLGAVFIADAVEMAEEYQGTFELMQMWSQTEDKKEREEIVADIQDEIDDWKELPSEAQVKPKVPFDDQDRIIKDVVDFKKKLRKHVDKFGGVNKVAKETGIPQPSLSKFFNSASRPRRSYVYKIANAIGLTDPDIAFDWYI
jgi:DNA-binding phage protein